MRSDKDVAAHMRQAGASYREIETKLKIPRSTLSGWFSAEGWSKDIRKKLTTAAAIHHTTRLLELNKTRGLNLEQAYSNARKEALEEFEILKYNPLFIAGLMIYWGEGDKRTDYQTRLINTDPDMLKLYMAFLTQVLSIPKTKIKASLLYYEDLDETRCRAYWSNYIGLPEENFSKSTLITGRHKTNRVTQGMCTVTVSSTYLKAKIKLWLELLPKELMRKEYYEIIA